MKRWTKICLVMIMILFMTGGGGRCLYAGEFGGFDIDIGAEEDIFDNWEEGPGESQETTEPELKDSGSSCEEKQESNNKSSNNESSNNSSNNSSNASNNDSANRDSGNNHNSNSAEASQSKMESSGKSSDTENSAVAAPPVNNSAENKKTDNLAIANDNANNAKRKNSKRKEETLNPAAPSEGKSLPGEKKDGNSSKTDGTTISPKIPKEERVIECRKFTALGSVSTAIGMARTSPELKFYNSNDENEENNEKITENNNKNIYFEHLESVPGNEYPRIRIIRRPEDQDVTILSLRYNDEEIFFHQEEDTLIFDQPVTRKRNRISLLAVIDGRRIVQMPVWEF